MNTKSPQYWLKVALIICVVSILGATFVQTSGGRVTVEDMRWETSHGKYMSALLFIPDNATVDNPAPAIITSHGWFNNREMQDMNFVEYSRRGYVVVSIDMYGHGNSGVLYTPERSSTGIGMYETVKLVANLPYVDKTRIGVTGHSNGSLAANNSIGIDNEVANPLISSVLLVARDAIYTDDDDNYFNYYGNRDVGIVAARYDEFFFRTRLEDGTRTAPGDYINQDNAQSFLNFGTDPAEGSKREASELYFQSVDGKDAIRAIYTPSQIHPWNTISNNVVTFSIRFFEESLGAPNPIPATNLVWYWKQLFNVIGLVGFAMFVLAFAKVLLDTEYFSSLKVSEEVAPQPAPTGSAKVWFWVSLFLMAFVSGYSYLKLPAFISEHELRPDFFLQSPVFFIGVWAVVSALFILIMIVISWFFFGAKNVSLKERGVSISLGNLWKTILLSLAVVISAFMIVFISDYLFKVDFRFWVIPVKAFMPDKFPIILMFAPFFLIFYIVHSVAVNCFNYFEQGKEWVNVAVLALFTTLGAIVYVVLQYGTFFATGYSWTEKLDPPVSNIYGIWLFPILLYFPLAVILDRKLYKVTKNPYLGGIIFALIMVTIACTNTLSQLP